MLNNRKVVGNKQIRRTVFLLQVRKQIEHLCLDGNVQRGNRLIADNKLRLKGKRTSNTNALALTTRELMRVAIDVLGVKTYHIKQATDVINTLFSRWHSPMNKQRLRNKLANGHTRVERCIRILENELHIAAHFLKTSLVKLTYILAIKHNFTAGRLDQAHDATTGG